MEIGSRCEEAGETLVTFDSLPYMRGQLGDLLAIDNPSPGDRNRIRLEMNKLQTQVSSMSAWMAPGGNLDPNLFQSHATSFSVLPHECASMYATTDQTIADATPETLVYDSANAATWNAGLKIDPSTGFIYVTGIPRETVILVVGWINWTANATGVRRLSLVASDASARYVYEFNPEAAIDTFQQIVHVRRIATAQTHYYLQGEQNSGGNLDTKYAGFTITRLR